MTSPLAELLAEEVLDGKPAPELFHAAAHAGHDLGEVLDVLADPFDHLPAHVAAEVEEAGVYGWTDILYELVEHAGMERAIEIAGRSSSFLDVDVRAHHAGVVARLRAQAAIMDEEPLATAYSLVADDTVPESHRTWLLESLARVYPIEELSEIATIVAPAHASVIGKVLRHHQTPLAALEYLLSELPPGSIVDVLVSFWGVERPSSGDALTSLVGTYATLSREEFRPLNRPLRFAASKANPEWWLPILREQGLKGSHAALTLLESGADSLRVARLLTQGGYSDGDVLTALLENGVGTRRSLSTLRDSGWSIQTMVQSLTERGQLLPEIRSHLEELGVPRAAQREVLLPHWPQPILALVLEGSSVNARLPSGDGDE